MRGLGVAFTVREATGPEPLPADDEAPANYALRAARAKTVGVAGLAEHKNCAVLGADTIVVLDGAILGKPLGNAQALAMLRRLRGRTHTVISAVCLSVPGGEERTVHCLSTESRVSMWDCPDGALENYAAGSEPLDKAGAYAVQGEGAFLVRSIEGSWSGVVGLPVAEVAALLARCGVIGA